MTASDLERRVAELETAVARHRERLAAADAGDGLSRRRLLQGLGVLGLGSVATATARADPQGQLGTATSPVRRVYAQGLAGGLTDGTLLTSLLGPGLDIDDETLQALVTGATTLGDGEPVFARLADGTLRFRSLVAGRNVDIDRREGELVLDADDSNTLPPWTDPDGDALLEPRSGTGYTGIDLTDVGGAKVVTPWVGTTDATAFEAFVAGTRVARFATEGSDPDGNTAAGNVLLGQYARANDSPVGAFVGGGGSPTDDHENLVTDDYGVVAGGENNRVGDDDGDATTANHAVVGGGWANVAGAENATIAGGSSNTASGYRSTVGGGYHNEVTADYATVVGGGPSDESTPSTTNNVVAARYGAIGGGGGNDVFDEYGTIAGGGDNRAGADDGSTDDSYATVGGGYGNTASAQDATVAGGSTNTAGGERSTVAGGFQNDASNDYATVPGGRDNAATGDYSFAAGRAADTDSNNGAFVWGDSSTTAATAGAPDEVRFQATGGFVIENTQQILITADLPAGSGNSVGINASNELVDTTASSARYKTNVRPLPNDTSGVLELRPRAYEYEETGQPDTGLIAEEVAEAVPELVVYDEDDRPDGVRYDRIGVFLAPEVCENRDRIAEAERDGADRADRLDDLAEALERRDERIADLERTLATETDRVETLVARLADREARIDDLEAELEATAERTERLEDRLAEVERALDATDRAE